MSHGSPSEDKEELFNKTLLNLQNLAYQSIIDSTKNFDMNFDSAMIDFIVRNQYTTEKELNEQRKKDRGDTIRRFLSLKGKHETNQIQLNSIMDNQQLDFNIDFKNMYRKELCLRGNLSAAGAIISLLVLKQYGGVVLDTDLLPEINQELFKNQIKITKEDPTGLASKREILRIILDHLTFVGEASSRMTGRAQELPSYGLEPVNQVQKAAIETIITQKAV